jgi:hypothetical protein
MLAVYSTSKPTYLYSIIGNFIIRQGITRPFRQAVSNQARDRGLGGRPGRPAC